MMQRAEIAVVFDGLALALTARCGGLSRATLDRGLGRAARLDRHHPARAAIEAFGAVWRAACADPVQIAAAGEALQRDLMRAMRPQPVDAGRVDIHG
jgi:hypothetical protein